MPGATFEIAHPAFDFGMVIQPLRALEYFAVGFHVTNDLVVMLPELVPPFKQRMNSNIQENPSPCKYKGMTSFPHRLAKSAGQLCLSLLPCQDKKSNIIKRGRVPGEIIQLFCEMIQLELRI